MIISIYRNLLNLNEALDVLLPQFLAAAEYLPAQRCCTFEVLLLHEMVEVVEADALSKRKESEQIS